MLKFNIFAKKKDFFLNNIFQVFHTDGKNYMRSEKFSFIWFHLICIKILLGRWHHYFECVKNRMCYRSICFPKSINSYSSALAPTKVCEISSCSRPVVVNYSSLSGPDHIYPFRLQVKWHGVYNVRCSSARCPYK